MTDEQQQLAINNIALAYHIALKGKHKPTTACTSDDLIGAALEGLCKAAVGYDSGRGVKFSTYAGRVIHNTICRELDIIRIHYPKTVHLSSDMMPQYGYYEDGYDDVEWNTLRRDVKRAKREALKKHSIEKQTIYRMWLACGNGSRIARLMHLSRIYVNAKVREINRDIRIEYNGLYKQTKERIEGATG